MIECCARFIQRFDEKKLRACWLALLGSVGTGKTHCGQRVWDHLSEEFDWHKFDYFHHKIYWPEFIMELRGGNKYEKLREMMRWPVLFLDDIGAERDSTGFAAEQLNMLLGCRVGRWTIITSNLNLHQLALIDPRIADRIIREPGNQHTELSIPSFGLRGN